MELRIHTLLKAAALVAGLVILQQLIARVIFMQPLNWAIIPQLTLINFGVVFGWSYLKNLGKMLLVLVTLIVTFFSALWVLAVVAILLLFWPAIKEVYRRIISYGFF